MWIDDPGNQDNGKWQKGLETLYKEKFHNFALEPKIKYWHHQFVFVSLIYLVQLFLEPNFFMGSLPAMYTAGVE